MRVGRFRITSIHARRARLPAAAVSGVRDRYSERSLGGRIEVREPSLCRRNLQLAVVPLATHLHESFVRLKIVRQARPGETTDTRINEEIAWGPGPRASQALMLAVRARALLEGRLAPSTEDVAALAKPVLQHRMALTFAARVEGITVDDVIARLIREA